MYWLRSPPALAGGSSQVEKQTKKYSGDYYIHYQCKECGRKYNNTTKFCSECGNEIIKIKDPILLNVFDLIHENDIDDEYIPLNNNYNDEDDFDLLGFNSENEFYEIFNKCDELHLTEQNFPKKATEEDHNDIIKLLKENDFKYEICFGLVLYNT